VITDDEFNFICANANSDEIEMLVDAVSGAENSLQLFTNIRKALEVRNKYLGVFQ
jgi:hypothetical protein